LAAAEEEGVGVHAIGDGAANEGHPVEHQWRVGALPSYRQQLAEDVEDNRQREGGEEANRCDEVDGLVAQVGRQQSADVGQ